MSRDNDLSTGDVTSDICPCFPLEMLTNFRYNILIAVARKIEPTYMSSVPSL